MEIQKETLRKLPHTPGIYMFRNDAGEILYIGKAKDLKKRVSSYFQRNSDFQKKSSLFVGQIHSIRTIPTDSEFDAILLESKLIRDHLPKYNAISRDDKSPLYIAITSNEPLPRLLWLRKSSLSTYHNISIFGPFQSGRVVRSIMHDIRRIIPYCTQKERDGKPCFYTHLGLCDPCPSVISHVKDTQLQKLLTITYKKNIRKIVAILSGKSFELLYDFEREMIKEAEQNAFEEAQRHKIQAQGLKTLLEQHYDPHIYIHNELFSRHIRQEEEESLRSMLASKYPGIASIRRIECIDISNTSGTYATGSVVVFIDGEPSTSDYKRFKIYSKDTPNDSAMVREVLMRRLGHTRWEYPQLLLIDGGKAQVRSATEVLTSLNISIPVIGLTKRFEEIVMPYGTHWKIIRLGISDKGLQLLMRIRDESHRFALRYHRLLRSRAFIKDKRV